jgi:Bacterial SH3 domain
VNALFLTVAIAASPASSSEELLAEARESYQSGLREQADSARAQPHFLRAAEAYERAWDAGTQTVAVARNMAQSRLLAGDLGGCIRNYRRGLQQYPHNPDLRRGLAFAREQVAYSHSSEVADAARPREAGSAFDRLPFSLVHLALFSVSLAALGWIVLARAWMTSRTGLALFGGAAIMIAALIGGGLWWEDLQARQHWSEPTAVLLAPADLRTGNSTEYPRRLDGRLPAGVEVKVLGERGGWLQVELAGGVVGWIQVDHIAVVN